MKLLLDINIILDVVLDDREPWDQEAASLLAVIDQGRAEGHIAAHSITTIYYLVAKMQGTKAAKAAITDLLRILHVVPVGKDDLLQALVLDFKDFEDAAQTAAALKIDANLIVTRNPKDFHGSPIPTQPAAAVLAMLLA